MICDVLEFLSGKRTIADILVPLKMSRLEKQNVSNHDERCRATDKNVDDIDSIPIAR